MRRQDAVLPAARALQAVLPTRCLPRRPQGAVSKGARASDFGCSTWSIPRLLPLPGRPLPLTARCGPLHCRWAGAQRAWHDEPWPSHRVCYELRCRGPSCSWWCPLGSWVCRCAAISVRRRWNRKLPDALFSRLRVHACLWRHVCAFFCHCEVDWWPPSLIPPPSPAHPTCSASCSSTASLAAPSTRACRGRAATCLTTQGHAASR